DLPGVAPQGVPAYHAEAVSGAREHLSATVLVERSRERKKKRPASRRALLCFTVNSILNQLPLHPRIPNLLITRIRRPSSSPRRLQNVTDLLPRVVDVPLRLHVRRPLLRARELHVQVLELPAQHRLDLPGVVL